MQFSEEEKEWIICQIKLTLDSYRISGKFGLNFNGRFDIVSCPITERRIMQSILKKLR